MWVKQCHKPPMTGKGKFIPPIKMLMWGMVYGIILPTLLIISWFFVLQLLRVWPTRFQIHRCKGSWQWTMSILKQDEQGAFAQHRWLVVDLPLWKIWKSGGITTPNIWKNKNCSKPPTSEPLMNIYIFIYLCIYVFMYLFIYSFIYFSYLFIYVFIYLLLVIIVNSQVIDEYEHVNIIPIWMRRFRNFHVLSTIFQDFRVAILFYSVDYHLIRKLFVAPWLLIWYGKWIPI